MRIKPLIYVVVVAASAVPVLVASGAGRRPGPGGEDIPSAALDAMGQGRHWQASRILHAYLAARKDTTPATVLLAAEAAAGWGDWVTVTSLLEGRPWLDDVGGGRGWWLLGRSREAAAVWDAAERDYGRYLAVAAGATARDRGLTRLRQARSLDRAGATTEALGVYAAAAADLPQLQDWIAIFAAEAAAEVGDTAAVTARLVDAGQALAADRGWRLTARARLALGDSAGAMDALRRAATSRPAADRAEAWERLGRLELAGSDTADAKDAFGRAMRTASRSVSAIDAARALSELPLDPRESLANAWTCAWTTPTPCSAPAGSGRRSSASWRCRTKQRPRGRGWPRRHSSWRVVPSIGRAA
jgi:tetratricopeptide (TPR) repeat protein